MHEGLDPEALSGDPGPDESPLSAEHIERLVDLLELNPELAVRCEIADRHGLPFKEVAQRWSLSDLAFHIANRVSRQRREARRCPSCGVDGSEQLKPGGRHLGENFAMRLDVLHCEWCAELAELEARIESKPFKKPGPLVRYVPRKLGETFAPEEYLFGSMPAMPPRIPDDPPPASEGP